MAQGRMGLFDDLWQYANRYQRETYEKFKSRGLTTDLFSATGWFDSDHHTQAFTFLVNIKKLGFKEAFSELQSLNQDQAYGISRGLTRDQVVGLNRNQIIAYLKCGLDGAETQGLSRQHIDALKGLRHLGLRGEDLRDMKDFDSDSRYALMYCVTVKKLSCKQALEYLQSMTSSERRAILHGLEKTEVSGLQRHQIDALIECKKNAALHSRTEVENLDEAALKVVRGWHHFGLTSDVVRKFPQVLGTYGDSYLFADMIYERGSPIDEIVELLSNFSSHQVNGFVRGLSKDDITGLNPVQIVALYQCRTIVNQLKAEDLRSRPWFNSDLHISALTYLLMQVGIPVQEALNGLEKLSQDQLQGLVWQKMTLDDLAGMNPWHLKALGSMPGYVGLRCEHLLGKTWFNSEAHVTVLRRLVDSLSSHHSIDAVLFDMAELNQDHMEMMAKHNFLRIGDVLALNPVQTKMLRVLNDYQINERLYMGIVHATWLQTEDQAALVGKLSAFSVDDLGSRLKVTEIATRKGSLIELIERIDAGLFSQEEFDQLKAMDVNEQEKPQNGCSMM